MHVNMSMCQFFVLKTSMKNMRSGLLYALWLVTHVAVASQLPPTTSHHLGRQLIRSAEPVDVSAGGRSRESILSCPEPI